MNPVCTHYLNLLVAFVKKAYHQEVNMLQIKSFANSKISELKHISIRILFKCIIILEYNIGYKMFSFMYINGYINSTNVCYVDLLK